MKHKSVALINSPIEFINITSISPLISKCQIKVCYVGDEPNRNHSVITKEVARSMANSLPGSPIVGFYNENTGDFEEHNRIIDISNGEFKIKDTTRPYGFVDLNAKVWFQKFIDDDEVEREYLVTEGYLWSKTYPECQRILDEGNNHSMELDKDTLDATWKMDSQGKPKFFIINEAVISKLCILGEECEPCFEGSQITEVKFSFEDEFKDQLFSMMRELTELLQGGQKMFNTYAVEIGDALWSALYSYLEHTYPGTEGWCSIYRIEGVYEEDNQKFAVIQHRDDLKYYRLDFSIDETNGFVPTTDLVEITKTFVPATEPQFSAEAVAEFEAEYAKNKNSEDKTGQTINNENDNTSEEQISTYSLEEIPEYVELQTKYSALEENLNTVSQERDTLKQTVEELTNFKRAVEKKEKEAMIAQFYMLTDEDKKDVIDNIDTYSLDDIEAKLSIICVRNKVSFAEESEEIPAASTTFSLSGCDFSDDTTPAWVKAALEVAKDLK